MPTYEFTCAKCGETFDVRATIQEKESGLQPACPNCGNQETRQVLSAGLFIRSSGGTSTFNPPGCAPNAGPGCCG
ncbi:MAG TPA: zinc ribbon domain-containing protein [Pelolinea sp.]|nr:zinc ribbon domain-containing protein [Pelolinea sp.]